MCLLVCRVHCKALKTGRNTELVNHVGDADCDQINGGLFPSHLITDTMNG